MHDLPSETGNPKGRVGQGILPLPRILTPYVSLYDIKFLDPSNSPVVYPSYAKGLNAVFVHLTVKRLLNVVWSGPLSLLAKRSTRCITLVV